jgi:hypothetical protein
LEVLVRLCVQLQPILREKQLTMSNHCIWVTELAGTFTSKFHE